MFRFTANGRPDTTFGGGDGKLAVAFAHDMYPYDLAALPGGKFLVSGELILSDSNSAMLVAQIRAGGRLDRTFGGGDGVVTTEFRVENDAAWRILVDPSGRPVVAGWTLEVGVMATDVAVARYTPDGRLDHSFSGDGKFVLRVFAGDEDSAAGMALRGTKIVLGIAASSAHEHMAFARLLENGTMDPTFGGGDGFVMGPAHDGRRLRDIGLDSHARLLAAAEDSTGQILVGRYMPNGRRDLGYGSFGFAHAAFATAPLLTGLAVTPADRAVVVGVVGPDVALARFTA